MISELEALKLMVPADKLIAIVPNDDKDLRAPIRGLYVGGTGTVTFDPKVEYLPKDFRVTITDAAETISESVQSGGEIYLANGGAVPAVGDIFEVRGAGDFKTVQSLAAAKGSAPVAGDQFIFTNVGVGTEALDYIASGAITLTALAAGVFHAVRATRIYSTGTAATTIVGVLEAGAS